MLPYHTRAISIVWELPCLFVCPWYGIEKGVRTCVHKVAKHDWVHGFPEPVKSFITFEILGQISCGKVQTKLIFFCIRPSQSFSLVCCCFPDYLEQLKKKRKILRDWVHTSVVRGNLENCCEPMQEKHLHSLVQKNMSFFALYRMKFDLV